MRTTLALNRPEDDFEAFVCDSDLIGYLKPSEIVRDPILTLARKRQLLAYWASDIHAVRGAPALRSYLSGPAVTIDEIKAALVELDTMVDAAAIPANGMRTVAA
jgi:hypothetical protein